MESWISVTDRLPEEGRDLLLAVKPRNSSKTYVWMRPCRFSKENGWMAYDVNKVTDNGKRDDFFTQFGWSWHITHWMYWPDAPTDTNRGLLPFETEVLNV